MDTTFDLQPYCDGCSEIEPQINGRGFWGEHLCEITIGCEHQIICARLKQHIDEQEATHNA